MEKEFLIIWSEPYAVTHSIECEKSINDPNRGFTELQREKINAMEVDTVLRFENSAFIVYRLK